MAWQEDDPFVRAACVLARKGGELARQRLGQALTSRKPDRSIVTDVDCRIQELILDHLARKFPDHAVIAEESLANPPATPKPGQAEYCWVVDPLDGTRNYARGFPIFATSIALLQAGQPIVGVTYDPMADRLYLAAAGRGAWLGRQRLTVADKLPHRDSLVTIPSSRRRPLPSAVTGWLQTVTLRNLGSTALHLAYIAAGLMDAEFELDAKLWDLAAGALMVTEAGGVVTSPKGKPIFPFRLSDYRGQETPFLAAGPRLHAWLLKSLT